MIRGIDVSHHQGNVNWKALKDTYKLDFGAAKATEGTSFRDTQFYSNWEEMKAVGLVRMAYHFARPDSNPAASANQFLAYVKSAGIEPSDIMVMDFESNPNNLPMATVNAWLMKWADIVTAATGRKPFIYTGSGYITNSSTFEVRRHFAGWWFPKYPSAYDGNSKWPSAIAGYPSPNNWGGAPDIWQFSQSFANKFDANVSALTVNELKTIGRQDTPVATLDKDDLTAIESIVQRYSAFNAENLRQRIDDIANAAARAVDASLQDDFTGVEAAVAAAKAELNKHVADSNVPQA